MDNPPRTRSAAIPTNRGHDAPNQEVMMIDVYWRTPFIDYIKEHKLPSDKKKRTSLTMLQELCSSRRQALQKRRIIRSTHEMHFMTRQQRHTGENSQRHLWQPRILMNDCG